VANAAGYGANSHFALLRLVDFYILDAEGLLGPMKHGGFHSKMLLVRRDLAGAFRAEARLAHALPLLPHWLIIATGQRCQVGSLPLHRGLGSAAAGHGIFPGPAAGIPRASAVLAVRGPSANEAKVARRTQRVRILRMRNPAKAFELEAESPHKKRGGASQGP